MNNKIILIGPLGAGKTTIGELLSNGLKLEWVQLDGIRYPCYEEIGYDKEIAAQKRVEGGLTALIAYWKPFEAHSVERVLADYDNCVIDFGAGHSVYEDDNLLERVKRALAPYPNVILLLPSPDAAESCQILYDRMLAEEGELSPEIAGLNEHFVKHRSNYELAKITVYTKDKTPEETCDEIVGRLK